MKNREFTTASNSTYKKLYIVIIFLFCCVSGYTQTKSEREHRIRQSQFPALQTDIPSLEKKVKRVQYYREVDSSKASYSLKFKLDRLHYHLDFDSKGRLKNSGFRVQEIDIPDDTNNAIKEYLVDNFGKTKIKRIFQEYPLPSDDSKQNDNPLKSTFQNLLLPTNRYKVIVRGAQGDQIGDYELWFNAEGTFLKMRTALPANHDRVLY